MQEDPRRSSVARAHIAALAFGWGIEPHQLTLALVQGCWPTTPLRDAPMTPTEVRQLAEHELELQPPTCQCASGGACLICN